MMQIAVTRELRDEPGACLAPSEAVSATSALRSVTSNAAWQLLSEHEVGSIEVGKCADFVVLSDDPTTVNGSRIGAIEVLETWVGGRKVFSR